MKEQFDFIAPTGDDLQGTLESVTGAASVCFTSSDSGEAFEHEGGTEIFWDGIQTQSCCGAVLFLCEGGEEWPAHHLIPADAEPLSAETLRLFAIEIALGRALDTAMESLEAVRGVLKVLGSTTPETSELITTLTRFTERDRPKRPVRGGTLIDHLNREYQRAKAVSIAAKDRELKAQAEESPRVSCDNCQWTGRERDCSEIVNLTQRVAPGEVMPAGECPDCGALCHLLENEEA
jgi:hypothetical protein